MGNGSDSIKKWRLTDFDIGPRLGTGKFGKVYLIREKQTQFIAALKVLSISQLKTHKLLKQAKNELEFQRILSKNKSGILPIFTWFMDQERIYVVVEYAIGGDLYSYMMKQPNKVLNKKDIILVIKQLAEILEIMHDNGIAHRDIKPENILLLNEGNVKKICLADLGWACKFNQDRRTTMCGTLDYLPPEMVRSQEYDASKVDVWALGILLYELLIGKPPFEAPTQSDTYRLIAKCKPQLPKTFEKDILLHDLLINKMLNLNPGNRPSCREILQSEWILQNLDTR